MNRRTCEKRLVLRDATGEGAASSTGATAELKTRCRAHIDQIPLGSLLALEISRVVVGCGHPRACVLEFDEEMGRRGCDGGIV